MTGWHELPQTHYEFLWNHMYMAEIKILYMKFECNIHPNIILPCFGLDYDFDPLVHTIVYQSNTIFNTLQQCKTTSLLFTTETSVMLTDPVVWEVAGMNNETWEPDIFLFTMDFYPVWQTMKCFKQITGTWEVKCQKVTTPILDIFLLIQMHSELHIVNTTVRCQISPKHNRYPRNLPVKSDLCFMIVAAVLLIL